MKEKRVSDARSLALDVLMGWERHRRPLDPILHRALTRSQLPPGDRALAYALVTGTVRWLRPLREEAAALCSRPLDLLPPVVRSIILLGLFQVRRLDRIPPYAAVSTAVDLAGERGHRGTASLVNAVLRRALREGPQAPAAQEDPVIRLGSAGSFPDWMVRRWIDQWGEERTAGWMEFSNGVAPLTIRVQGPAGSRDAALERLCAAGVAARAAERSPAGIILGEGAGPEALERVIPGIWLAQDEAAQLIAPLLGVCPGERVLDAAAAPGGKTTHLFDLMGGEGELVAADRSAERIGLLRGTLDRLGIRGVTTSVTDLLAPPAAWRGRFDAVLLDAPCSGLGTIRRHPDIKWTRTPGDVARLAREQRLLLASCLTLLAPGGRLLYSTCTTEPEENAMVVEEALQAGRAVVDPIGADEARGGDLVDGPWFRTAPAGGMDGFFAARIRRPND